MRRSTGRFGHFLVFFLSDLSLDASVDTGLRDTTARLKSLLDQKGFKITELRTSVEVAKRECWLLNQVDRGVEIVTGTVTVLYALLFGATGIHDKGVRFATVEVLSIPDTVVRNAYVANRQAIKVVMIGTKLVGLRLPSLLLTLPLVMLVYLFALAMDCVNGRYDGGVKYGSQQVCIAEQSMAGTACRSGFVDRVVDPDCDRCALAWDAGRDELGSHGTSAIRVLQETYLS